MTTMLRCTDFATALACPILRTHEAIVEMAREAAETLAGHWHPSTVPCTPDAPWQDCPAHSAAFTAFLAHAAAPRPMRERTA